ncbi:hypothetical protein ATANTOWER_015075 [Ataeniobius toweri]|uniref:Uncharacterized protein n=1 Tax=Ataeniobius toweri TaxID=208326 RepID=A0ABU7C608_9TELE|nr:hypothetical protein [Ataeniobius toweri]
MLVPDWLLTASVCIHTTPVLKAVDTPVQGETEREAEAGVPFKRKEAEARTAFKSPSSVEAVAFRGV